MKIQTPTLVQELKSKYPPDAAQPILSSGSTTQGSYSMLPSISAEVFIQGITANGKTFRPSDWAERLAGVMSQFRPRSATQLDGHLGYSPWCLPTTMNGIKCVVVKRELQEREPMAWDFVMNFARDNGLQTIDACLLPEDGAPNT